jgi:hypothetical protein
MRKDSELNGDINLDTVSGTNGNTNSDFAGDIASDRGTDLNMADGQQDVPSKSEANGLSMSKDTSWRERIGAGISALGAIASPIHSQYAQLENLNEYAAPVDSAIYQEYNNPNQQIDNELAQFAQLQELENREQSREASDLNSVLNEPMSSDNCDPPQVESADMSLINLDTEDES